MDRKRTLMPRIGRPVLPMSERQCDTQTVDDRKFVIGAHCVSSRFAVVRLPDGLTLSAGGWDDVWAACPEFNVPWRNVEFEDEAVRDQALKAWGDHPDMPIV